MSSPWLPGPSYYFLLYPLKTQIVPHNIINLKCTILKKAILSKAAYYLANSFVTLEKLTAILKSFQKI
jgi:hypothetical protein